MLLRLPNLSRTLTFTVGLNIVPAVASLGATPKDKLAAAAGEIVNVLEVRPVRLPSLAASL